MRKQIKFSLLQMISTNICQAQNNNKIILHTKRLWRCHLNLIELPILFCLSWGSMAVYRKDTLLLSWGNQIIIWYVFIWTNFNLIPIQPSVDSQYVFLLLFWNRHNYENLNEKTKKVNILTNCPFCLWTRSTGFNLQVQVT